MTWQGMLAGLVFGLGLTFIIFAGPALVLMTLAGVAKLFDRLPCPGRAWARARWAARMGEDR